MTDINIEVDSRVTYKIQVYDKPSRVRPNFNQLGDFQQRLICDRLKPKETLLATNIAQRPLLEDFVDQLDPGQTATGYVADQIVFGSGTTEPSTTDASLDSQFASTSVGSYSDNGTELATTTVIDENTNNGENFGEVGLRDSGNTTLLNRALIGPRVKNQGEVFTIDVSIIFTAL